MTSTQTDSEIVDFVVDRSNLRSCKFVRSADAAELGAGQVLLRIDRFAFTANNITYAVAGDMLSYWSFFPAAPGWGRVPVWGFADVARSRHSAIAEGTRVFGYLPMSTYVVVQPDAIGHRGFVDGAPHRAGLPPIYNQYVLVAQDPAFSAQHEDQESLFRPTFTTSFLLDDFIADNGGFGAETVVLSSASSKTALGLAFLLSRAHRAQVVGLTSARNARFVEGVGCYHQVITYDRIAALPTEPAVFVDMAGDAAVTKAVHEHYRAALKHSASVGVTHWEQRGEAEELPGAPPTFFFAPTQLQKRVQDWGIDGFEERRSEAWRQFQDFAGQHIRIVHGRGEHAVEQVYLQMLDGRVRPDEGHILSLRG